MDTRGKGQMLVGRPGNIEPARIVKCLRVMIGPADAGQHLGARFERDPGNLEGFGDPAIADLQRAVKTQHFLDGRAEQRRIILQQFQLIGIVEQRHHPVADQIGRGLVATIEQQDAILNQLFGGQRVIFGFLRIDQVFKNIAGANALGHIAPFLVQQVEQKTREIDNGLVAFLDHFGGRRRLERRQDQARPFLQGAAIFRRNPQHRADHFDGQRIGKIQNQVHAPLFLTIGDQPIDQIDHPVFEHLQRAWRKGMAEQVANTGVIGRIAEQHRRRVLLEQRPLPVFLREHLGLVRGHALGPVNPTHILVAGQIDRAVCIGVHRLKLTERVVIGIRAFIESRRRRKNIETVHQLVRGLDHSRRLGHGPLTLVGSRAPI